MSELHMPISMEWSKEEVIDAVNFFQTVERAHHKAVPREDILALYNRFKEIVPSKSEEKQLFRTFDERAEVSCWQAVQAAKKAEPGEKVKL
ncbi:UPF0223 family protein [Alteribacillus iranensis]|uniref:Uncharacterized protein YktA, UPF0223 family n=1 Tax=Alteribacillus iranensis TaxID=930128 RepID=A0A1I2AHQ6_9BACI|nr:UPF0223 family protein [Alteribacillus iranensis]SFE42503.1 Uncharacterized protein YktA, UPF0223 family [Alteribacillus iranensis]